MCEFVSFNVLDTDYVQEKYKGTKNNRLEDITDVEDKEFHDVRESESGEGVEEGAKDLPPHLQKLIKKIEKKQKDWNKKYPDAQIVGHRDLDYKKFCPSFDVRKYLLNEDIPNYKFQDGLTSEADLEELRDDGVI